MDEKRLIALSSDHSLVDLEKVEVYWKWSKASQPFSCVNSAGQCEKLWIDGKVKVYEEFDDKSGSKFGYDPDKLTYFYESWTPGFLVKVWRSPDLQWGELQRTLASSKSTEKWSLSASEKTYELFQFENEQYKSGRKYGSKEEVQWYEKWHEWPGDSLLEKWWEQSERSWGEVSGFYQGKKWSERWERNGDEFLSQKVGEHEGKTWSSLEGRQGVESWGENWTSSGSGETVHDRYWANTQRRWGIWTSTREDETVSEEWEEGADCKKKQVTVSYHHGKEVQRVTGVGDDYEYTDIFEKLPDGSHFTRKKGHNERNSWSLRHWNERGGVFRVKYKGRNEEGSWVETWQDSPDSKSAYKAGSRVTGDSWEESWVETPLRKECYKHGKRVGEEWWEQWEETDERKHCMKRQSAAEREARQEWVEEKLGGLRRTKGCCEENGAKVREWDEVLDS